MKLFFHFKLFTPAKSCVSCWRVWSLDRCELVNTLPAVFAQRIFVVYKKTTFTSDPNVSTWKFLDCAEERPSQPIRHLAPRGVLMLITNVRLARSNAMSLILNSKSLSSETQASDLANSCSIKSWLIPVKDHTTARLCQNHSDQRPTLSRSRNPKLVGQLCRSNYLNQFTNHLWQVWCRANLHWLIS